MHHPPRQFLTTLLQVGFEPRGLTLFRCSCRQFDPRDAVVPIPSGSFSSSFVLFSSPSSFVPSADDPGRLRPLVPPHSVLCLVIFPLRLRSLPPMLTFQIHPEEAAESLRRLLEKNQRELRWHVSKANDLLAKWAAQVRSGHEEWAKWIKNRKS